MECSIEGCVKPVKVKSFMLCSPHYHRQRETGDALTPYKRTPDSVPIEERIEKTGYTLSGSGCHEWGGRLDDFGYPIIKYRQKALRVHRWVLECKTGEALGELYACHTCDNPCCINPDHLFPGTQAENMRDMVEKGRGRTGNKRWTPEQVLEMVELARGGAVLSDIESKFGASSGTLARIMKGQIWSKVTGIGLTDPVPRARLDTSQQNEEE